MAFEVEFLFQVFMGLAYVGVQLEGLDTTTHADGGFGHVGEGHDGYFLYQLGFEEGIGQIELHNHLIVGPGSILVIQLIHPHGEEDQPNQLPIDLCLLDP